jgi:CRP-like cAMP-binding protein
MMELELQNMLSTHLFLRGFSDRNLATLARFARKVNYDGGQFLGREGEPANVFCLLCSGRASLEIHTPKRGVMRIQTVGTGEPVGWSWMVPPHRWQFDARVLEPTGAIVFDGKALREQCERDHELGYSLLKRLVSVIAGRLAATRLQLLDIYK